MLNIKEKQNSHKAGLLSWEEFIDSEGWLAFNVFVKLLELGEKNQVLLHKFHSNPPSDSPVTCDHEQING